MNPILVRTVSVGRRIVEQAVKRLVVVIFEVISSQQSAIIQY